MSVSSSQKSCSICGKSQPRSEFSYGNREDRSYCKTCNKLERQAYARGGAAAAEAFREEQRRSWQ
ncbi:hypothetical protein PAGU2595_029660 [Lysobacter xanthus]